MPTLHPSKSPCVLCGIVACTCSHNLIFFIARWCGRKRVKLVVPLPSARDLQGPSKGSMVKVTMMVPSTSWSASMELATLRTPRICSTSSIPTELDHLAVTALPSTLSVSPISSSALRVIATANSKPRLHNTLLLPFMVDYAVSRPTPNFSI